MAQKTIPFTLTVEALPEFYPMIAPTSLTVRKGTAAVYRITATADPGFTGQLVLNLLGMPEGTSITFDPPTIAPGEESVLTIETFDDYILPGVYDLTLVVDEIG